MIVSVVFIVLAVLAVAQLRSKPLTSDGVGVSVRRFFQYLLLSAMVVIVAIGISGLLGRGLDRGSLIVSDTIDLARDLAFIVVGVPTLVVVAMLTRARLREGPEEARSLAWLLYLALAEIVGLTIAIAAAQDVLLWIVQARRFDSGAVARTLVWGTVWAVHLRIGSRIPPRGRESRIGAAVVGLWTLAAGISSLVSTAYSSLLSEPLVVEGTSPVAAALAAILVGGGVWAGYWIGALRSAPKTAARQVYLVVVGVAGGLIASIIGGTIIIYHVLVWWLGVPWTSDAASHFRSAAGAVGALASGLLVWSFHRAVVARERGPVRDEAHRIAQYITAGIALVAVGVAAVVFTVAGLEAATATVSLAGQPARNTLLLACTLLLVGGPVWGWWWRDIRRAVSADPVGERSSTARRVYLFALFGVVGLAAVTALIVAVAFLFDDIVAGRVGWNTLRRARWALGVLASAGAIAFGHWRVYRSDRMHAIEPALRHLVIVGPLAADTQRALHDRLGARIETWRTEGEPWSVDAIVAAIDGIGGGTVVVVAADDGSPRAQPAERA